MIASRADGGRRRAWIGWGWVVVSAGAALAAALLLKPWVGDRPFLIVFVIPIAVSVTVGGFGGAVHNGANRCGVVITDLGMPYVDGRQVSEEVKAISAGTPVILLTGWGQRLLATDVPASVDCVLSKPPTGRGLRSALARCLESEERISL